MERQLRSRGFRIYFADKKITCKEKVYYEPDITCVYNNVNIRMLEDLGILNLFEYSMIEDQIDGINFHVDLTKNTYKTLYKDLPITIIKKFDAIASCMGDCMKNYTIGYRLKEDAIEQQVFYFYPTVWKETRYGIKGITDRRTICNGLNSFIERAVNPLLNNDDKVKAFIDNIYKFKGISVHLSNNKIGYKIYGRILYENLKKYLFTYFDYDIDLLSKYGDCVLTAIRLADQRVEGINIYFLR